MFRYLWGEVLARDCDGLSLRVHHALLDDIPLREKKVAFDFLRKVNTRLLALEQQDLYPFHGPAQLGKIAAQQAPGAVPGSPRTRSQAKP
jgi:hypothetical protein